MVAAEVVDKVAAVLAVEVAAVTSQAGKWGCRPRGGNNDVMEAMFILAAPLALEASYKAENFNLDILKLVIRQRS